MAIVCTVRRAVIGIVLLLATAANYHIFLSVDTSTAITNNVSTATEEHHQLNNLEDTTDDTTSLGGDNANMGRNKKGFKGDTSRVNNKQAITSRGGGRGNITTSATQSSTSSLLSTRTPSKFKRSDYRYCAIKPTPTVNNSLVHMEQMPEGNMDLWYQCAGKAYNDYMEKLWDQVVKVKHSTNDNPQWGKRPTPIPPGKTILVMGNSHTRQVMTTFLCQYKELIVNSTQIAPVPGKKNAAMKILLQHDITIYVIVNHPFVYSKRWHLTLSIDILKFSFKKLDAIVLGSFNRLKESHKTTFLSTTIQYQKEMPKHRVNIHQQEPPYMEDVAKVYGGNIVWMSMFAKYNQDYHNAAVQMISSLRLQNDTSGREVDHRPIQYHHLTKRNNLRAVYGRQYIDSHLHGIECSSDQSNKVSTCLVDNTTARYQNGHKCVGRYGGFPDLIAWDLIEALYDLLLEGEGRGGGGDQVK